jgi:hypothetical protein
MHRSPTLLHAVLFLAACLLGGALADDPAQAGPAQAPVAPPAEEPELETDRPDFTESAVVVPRGSLQVESGFSWLARRGVRLADGPELLLRWGVAPRTELRVEPPSYFRLSGAEHFSGFGDTVLALKQQLGPTRSGFDVALIPGVSLPTGAHSITSGAPDPEISMAWSRDLGRRWSMGGLFGFFWPTQEDGRNFTAVATLVLGCELGGPWSAFLEYAGEMPRRGGSSHLAHHGYTYALTPTSQLDLHFGFGFAGSDAPAYFVGAGYSIRIGR